MVLNRILDEINVLQQHMHQPAYILLGKLAYKMLLYECDADPLLKSISVHYVPVVMSAKIDEMFIQVLRCPSDEYIFS